MKLKKGFYTIVKPFLVKLSIFGRTAAVDLFESVEEVGLAADVFLQEDVTDRHIAVKQGIAERIQFLFEDVIFKAHSGVMSLT